MQRLCELCIWLLAASLHHVAHTCGPGSTTEIPFNSGINVSPLLNIDRNELDILLSFVGDPPLPLTSDYSKPFSSETLSTTLPSSNRQIRLQTDRNSVGSIASKGQQLDHSKSGKIRGRSTDPIVDNVLQAYKRVRDKTSRSLRKCKNSTSSLLKTLSALWAERIVDSILHSFEPPSSRKGFVKRIVKKFLSEEFVPENEWLEHLESVLCNCYYAIAKTFSEATRCYECRVIADDIVFVFFVEDLLTEILSSHHEMYVSEAVGKLLEMSGISNEKQSVWKALFNQKQNPDINKKFHIEGKKILKPGLLLEKSLVAAVFSGAMIGGGGKSNWGLSPRDTSSKENQKLSITSDYEGTDFAPFGDITLVPLVFESEYEITDEYLDFENNWKQTSLKQSGRPSEEGNASPKGDSVDGYGDLLSAELAYLVKDALPTTQDVTFRSTDYVELTLVTRLIPDAVEKDRVLEIKKHYPPQLKETKTHFEHESPKNDTKMLKGYKTHDGSNRSLTLSEEKNEGYKSKNSQNSYTESKWSPFFNPLDSWLQFLEKMKGSDPVESGLESDVGTLYSKKTTSSSGSKLSLSEGNQRTGTSVATGETGLNLKREDKQISYKDTVAVTELANELAKMINASRDKGERGWNELAEDKSVDTLTALDTGSAVNKKTKSSILRTVTDFLITLQKHISNMARFIKSQF